MPRTVPNMCDYVRTQLDSLDERGLCRVDSLVLSWLSYLTMPPEAALAPGESDLTIADLARPEWAESLCGRTFDAASSWELLQACAASPRFSALVVSDHVEDSDERLERQFSATTFELPGHGHYVAFRGTDNTLVGWKEDFNMAYATEVPSQASAVAYLERVASTRDGDLWLGGHSKGGNLATYAATMCADACRGRVAGVFSHDGPGLTSAVAADGRWERTRGLVDKTIPRSSVIGLLFENQGVDVTVVKSDTVGLFQHDPFSWEVAGRDFVCAERVGTGSVLIDSSLGVWLSQLTAEERASFIDAIYDVVAASGEKTLAGIRRNWQVAVPRMIGAAQRLDDAEREHVMRALRAIVDVLLPGRGRLSQLGLMVWESMLDRAARLGPPRQA